jgi:sulfite dehydrogenase (cytochrome) subunit B
MRISAILLAAAGLAAATGFPRTPPKFAVLPEPMASFGLVSPAEAATYALPDETAMLRPGPGVEAAENNCKACHSADYLSMQPPKKGEAFWGAEVQKMIKVYHAPIGEADAKTITDYLAQTY